MWIRESRFFVLEIRYLGGDQKQNKHKYVSILAQMSLFHEDKLLNQRHILSFSVTKDRSDPRYLLSVVIIVIQISTIVNTLGFLH